MHLLAILLLIIGGYQLFMPKKALEIGRRYLYGDSKEPNAGALFFTRMMGLFVIVLSLYAIIIMIKK